jgi:hypothetical protein
MRRLAVIFMAVVPLLSFGQLISGWINLDVSPLIYIFAKKEYEKKRIILCVIDVPFHGWVFGR